MNFARLLLASAAVAVLAACSSDPITAPVDPRRSSAVEDVVVDERPDSADLDDQRVNAGECLVITTTIGGITTTVNTCLELGPHISGGGG